MGRADKTLKEITQSLTTYSERIQVLDKQRMCPGIRASQLSAKLNNENSYASVMRSLAGKMNATSVGGNQ